MYVANSGGSNISVINTDNNTVTTIGIASNPNNLAINPAGTRLYVTYTSAVEDRITVINTATNGLSFIRVGTNQGGIAFNPF